LIGQGASFKDAEEFARLLQGKLNVTVRRSRGADIDAACGQLKRKVLD
jgi:adenine C2-methylase RlmN of 23S rRNA A2503 and tRNA A37